MSTSYVSRLPIVYVLSDHLGETEELVRAATCQLAGVNFDIRHISNLQSAQELEEALNNIPSAGSTVLSTFMQPELQEKLNTTACQLGLTHVDILKPVIDSLKSAAHISDSNNNSKITPTEFAEAFDDGKQPWGLLQADIILIGVSRTSKTPLCMYLANKGYKTANVPIIPNTALPPELYQAAHKVIGLTINPSLLLEIRRERLKTMGITQDANYATMENLITELNYAQSIMHSINCPIIDVSYKATEEIAVKVLEIYNKRQQS